MDAVSVAKLVSPGKPGGTTLWASERVLSLVGGDVGGLDTTQRGLLRKRMYEKVDRIREGGQWQKIK